MPVAYPGSKSEAACPLSLSDPPTPCQPLPPHVLSKSEKLLVSPTPAHKAGVDMLQNCGEFWWLERFTIGCSLTSVRVPRPSAEEGDEAMSLFPSGGYTES